MKIQQRPAGQPEEDPVRRTRIVHVTRGFFPGLGNLTVYDYSTALAAMGYKVEVICTRREGESVDESVEGVRVIRLPIGRGGLLNTIRFHFRAWRTMRENSSHDEHPLIAHCYFSKGCFFLPLAARFQRRQCGRSLFMLDVRSGPVSGKLGSAITTVFLRTSWPLFDGLAFIDERLRDRLLTAVTSREVFILPLGSDFDLFQKDEIERQKIRAELGIGPEDVVFIYAGVLDRRRPIDTLLKAFASIERRPEKTPLFRLLLAGDGADRQRLESLCRELLIESGVTFLGHVPYRSMPRFLSAADAAVAFVPVSKTFDLQPPKKTVDYLACGLPVIATNTAGNRLFIKNGINGLLVNDDLAELSGAMYELASETGLIYRLAGLARPSVLGYHTVNIVRERLLPAYRRLLCNI